MRLGVDVRHEGQNPDFRVSGSRLSVERVYVEVPGVSKQVIKEVMHSSSLISREPIIPFGMYHLLPISSKPACKHRPNPKP